MELKNPQFRSVEIKEKDVVLFPNGIPGFEGITRFVVVEDDDSAPLCWLVPVDDPEVAFAVVDPRTFFPDYHVVLPQSDQDALRLQSEEDARVLVIVVVSTEPTEITANLMGPLVINSRAGLGKQVVLADSGYPVRTPLLSEALLKCAK
ncbi:MAG TPA: flagellar assembly protein FliW [Chroococcales cyanobacterium]|jgi:flagellar assembly factor FliW